MVTVTPACFSECLLYWENGAREPDSNSDRKFGHAQGVLKRKPIHMAEFEIVLVDLENPGYGDVAPCSRHVTPRDLYLTRSLI